MAKNKEQRNLLKEQIITAVSPIIEKLDKAASEKTQKRLGKVADELAKKFYEELASIEKKNLKAESKSKKAEEGKIAGVKTPKAKKTKSSVILKSKKGDGVKPSAPLKKSKVAAIKTTKKTEK